MVSVNSIEIKNLSKKFAVRYTTTYGGLAKSGTKQVLDDITFDVKKGETIGIVGRNGSGKSTLLKIICGIMDADAGECSVNGRVASILELGIGFNPELSGRDNIYLKCGLYGLSSSEVDEVIDSIIKFSEINNQIDLPLRTYSSGMKAKLAFSVITHVKCDIMIMDEALSVGDSSFNYKCKLVFDKFKKQDKSIIIASHNIKSLEKMCDRVVWIEDGRIREIGDAQTVCYRYESSSFDNYDTVSSLAETGDLISINRLGEMFRDGIGVEKDLEKAKEQFLKASDMGYLDSQINLARIYCSEGNSGIAKQLLEKSALSNDIRALTLMMQIDNIDTRDDLIKTVTELSDSGNMRATIMLADILYNSSLFTNERGLAIELYEKSAKYGNSQASFALGIVFRDGIGTNKDSQKAIYYLEQAADRGHKRAVSELANMYRKGIGVEKDMEKAIYWYEKSAMLGNVKSIMELGTIYRDGIGVSSDPYKSEMWMKKLADIELSEVENNLGDILFQGYTGDIQKSCIKWYEDAASRGNVAAILNLSAIYRNGSIVPADVKKSNELLEQASNQGNAFAMYDLATYLLSIDEPEKRDYALKLLQKSIDRGNRRAMSYYVSLYRDNDKGPDQVYENSIRFLRESGDLYSLLKSIKE